MKRKVTKKLATKGGKRQSAPLGRKDVIAVIAKKTAMKKSTLVIFDLDGTLFDNRTRTLFILREISEKFSTKTPGLYGAFERILDLSIVDYSLNVTLKRIGVKHPAETSFIKQEWTRRFFSDEYQKFDMPISGAKGYVEQIHEAGAMTIVKKEFEQEDEIFKEEVSDYIDRLGEVVAVFENEPANSNILHARFPDAASFFVMTQHRPDAPRLDGGIRRIRNFRLPGRRS